MTGPAEMSPLLIDPTALSVRDTGPWLLSALGVLPAAEAAAVAARLELAVHEVGMNVVDHANLGAGQKIRFDIDIVTSRVTVTVTDRGDSFDVTGVPDPVSGIPQIRGYGLMIVRKLVDDLDYRRVGEDNRLTLRIDRSTTEESTP